MNDETSAAPGAPAADVARTVQDIIDGWVRDQVRDSAIARSTDAYNHLITVLPDLAQRLKERT